MLNKPDILEIISRYILLEKSNDVEYKGACPFHDDKNPSLFVNTEKQVYWCFGCEAKGDVIDFVMGYKHIDFSDAIELLDIKSDASNNSVKKKIKRNTDTDSNISKINKYFPAPKEKRTYDINLAHKYNNDLFLDTEALSIIKDYWCINEDIIKKQMIGIKEHDGKKWIVFPFFQNNEIRLIKYRTLPTKYNKMFMRSDGDESILYHFDAFDINVKEIFVTEGESKVLGCLSHGIDNVVGNSIGASGWNSAWNEYFEKYESVYIIYDNDEAGKFGAMQLSNKLGGERMVIVNLPDDNDIKDINDYFKYHTKDDLLKLAHDTERKRNFIYTISNSYEYLRESLFFKENDDNMRNVFPWPSMNEALSINNGDVVTVSGVPGTGKTSFLLNIALHLAKQDVPVLFVCLEMLPHILLRKIISMNQKFPYKNINIDIVSDNEYLYNKLPLYFGYIQYNQKLNIDTVQQMIDISVKKYGVRFIFIDHLDYLCRSIKYVTQETAKNMQTFKTIAMQTQSTIFLVQHPRKLGEGLIATMNDLKNSSAVAADSDRVILLHRPREGNDCDKNDSELEYGMSPFTLVRIEKGRLDAEKQLIYYFEGDKSLFRELTKDERILFNAKRAGKSEKKKKYLQ